MEFPTRSVENFADVVRDTADKIAYFVEDHHLEPLLRIVRDGALGVAGLVGVSVLGNRYLFGEVSGIVEDECLVELTSDLSPLKQNMSDQLKSVYLRLQNEGFEPVELDTMSSSVSSNLTAGDLQAQSIALEEDTLGSAQFYADQAECSTANLSKTLRAGFFYRPDDDDNTYRDRAHTVAFKLPDDTTPDVLGQVLRDFSLGDCSLDQWALLRDQANTIQPSDPSVGRAFAVEIICPCPAAS